MAMTNRVQEALDIVCRVARLGAYDTNVIGMAAEIIAEDMFGLRKTARGTRDIDGTWMSGGKEKRVQVKAWSEERVKRYGRGAFFQIPEGPHGPDELLVLLICSSQPRYEILYQGPAREVGRVEENGHTRAVRLDSMKTQQEIDTLLKKLREAPSE